MMRVGLALAGLAVVQALAAPAAAQRPRIGWDVADALAAEVASCPAAQMPPGARRSARGMHVHDEEGYVLRQLELMLRAAPAACPGIAAAAAARLRALVGEPQRADVSERVLRLARIAAEEGLGMARDAALADRLGRIEWLFAVQEPAIPRWTATQQRLWLGRPEVAALLEARVAAFAHSARQERLLAELRLRRDVPGYDPSHALILFWRAGDHERFDALLRDDAHPPRDYRRAFAPMFRLGTFDIYDDHQRMILRVGRRAAEIARTPEARAEALRLLFAGSVNDIDGSCALLAPQLRHFESVPIVPLAAGDAERIRDNLGAPEPYVISDDPALLRPIALRVLIGPDGRVAYARVQQSSGSRTRDRFAIGAWARYAEAVDLSATARGRLVWADLPPIPQRSATTINAATPPRSSCR